MTKFSGGMDNCNFDGNTILLEVEVKKYVYISRLENSEFRTDDKILDYLSLLGNNMLPYTFIGWKKIYIFQINSL